MESRTLVKQAARDIRSGPAKAGPAATRRARLGLNYLAGGLP
jgi:hypothetical protein